MEEGGVSCMKRSRGKAIKDWHMRFGRTKLGRREE